MADVVAAAVAAAAGRARPHRSSSTIDGDAAAVHQGRRRPGPHAARGRRRGCTTRPGRQPPARSSTWWPASTPTSWARTCWAGRTCSTQADVAALRREVAAEPAVHRLIDRLWPRLTAERLRRATCSPPAERLAAGDPRLDEADRELLLRPASAPWTPADVPLLEEADELLGVDDSAQRAAARRATEQRRLRHAQETLDLLHGSRSHRRETEDEAEELQRRRPARRRGAGRAARGRPTPAAPPSAPRPTAPGPTGT